MEGSASYLNDEIETDEHVRMTFSFKKKGRQVIANSAESTIDSEMCKVAGATHVVTEVKYGFNAYLLFESKESEDLSKEEIAGSLRILIKFAESFEVEGYGNFSFSDIDEYVANTLSFKFYGDTVVDPPPQTFENAVEVYQQLPARSLVDERVVSFSLAPLSDYCEQEDVILNEIASSNVETVSNMIVDFEDVDKMLRKLKNHKLPTDFQSYRAILLDLESRFELAKTYFKAKIQTLLPKIRSGTAEEQELTDLLKEYKQSVFEKESFLLLLGTRQKEIETAEFIIYHPSLPSNKYVDLDHTGDMANCIIGHEYALVYELEILPTNTTHLGEMFEAKTLDETDKWFMNEDEVGDNRPLMNDFIQLAIKNQEEGSASICFLISVNQIGDSGENGKAFQLKLLKNGKTIVDGFRAPQKIWKMEEVERGVDYTELKLHHEADNGLQLESSYFQLKATYEMIGAGVSCSIMRIALNPHFIHEYLLIFITYL